MENVQKVGVNLENKQFWANWGCFWTPWEPRPPKKNSFLAENVKLRSIVKLCIVFKDILAKTPKIIQRKRKKGILGPILSQF